jgi:hypothetical protein
MHECMHSVRIQAHVLISVCVHGYQERAAIVYVTYRQAMGASHFEFIISIVVTVCI